MHKNEALPCPAGLDPASHPVETVGTRRVALGHASMGLRVEARKDTRESTFNILRKYFHRLTKREFDISLTQGVVYFYQ